MQDNQHENQIPEIPSFATVMRGYDRLQVDDYIDMLQESLSESQVRMLAAEDEAITLRTQISETASTDPRPRLEEDPPTRTDYAGTADTVAAHVQNILAAAEVAATALHSAADTDRENARRIFESAEHDARQHAAELVADARDTVERLTRRTEIERSRRDNVRRQLAALRSMLEGIDEPETGEIDLTALDMHSLQSADPAEGQSEAVAARETAEDLTVLLSLPQ